MNHEIQPFLPRDWYGQTVSVQQNTDIQDSKGTLLNANATGLLLSMTGFTAFFPWATIWRVVKDA